MADLADGAALIVRAQPRSLARVDDARAPGLRPGTARFYVEARTVALITGRAALGPTLAFLADLPLDARGKPPVLKKRDVLLFARAVPARPEANGDAERTELSLVAPDAMLLWSVEGDARLRGIVTALIAPDAPARITGVREIAHVPGSLAGAGETQAFLATADGSAASLTVERAPGRLPRWGASFSELVAATGSPPARDTLAWYRLACFLPRALPAEADRSETPEAQAQAGADYRFVLDALGSCPRLRASSRR